MKTWNQYPVIKFSYFNKETLKHYIYQGDILLRSSAFPIDTIRILRSHRISLQIWNSFLSYYTNYLFNEFCILQKRTLRWLYGVNNSDSSEPLVLKNIILTLISILILNKTGKLRILHHSCLEHKIDKSKFEIAQTKQ